MYTAVVHRWQVGTPPHRRGRPIVPHRSKAQIERPSPTPHDVPASYSCTRPRHAPKANQKRPPWSPHRTLPPSHTDRRSEERRGFGMVRSDEQAGGARVARAPQDMYMYVLCMYMCGSLPRTRAVQPRATPSDLQTSAPRCRARLRSFVSVGPLVRANGLLPTAVASSVTRRAAMHVSGPAVASSVTQRAAMHVSGPAVASSVMRRAAMHVTAAAAARRCAAQTPALTAAARRRTTVACPLAGARRRPAQSSASYLAAAVGHHRRARMPASRQPPRRRRRARRHRAPVRRGKPPCVI